MAMLQSEYNNLITNYTLKAQFKVFNSNLLKENTLMGLKPAITWMVTRTTALVNTAMYSYGLSLTYGY